MDQIRSEQILIGLRECYKLLKGLEKEVKSEIRKKEKSFVIPTTEEVKLYCKERNNNVDSESFINFYESKGWLIGKNKMKNWQAAVRTWEKSNTKEEKDYIRKEWQPPIN